MYCPHCGTELEEGSHFCGNCGQAISDGMPENHAEDQASNTVIKATDIFPMALSQSKAQDNIPHQTTIPHQATITQQIAPNAPVAKQSTQAPWHTTAIQQPPQAAWQATTDAMPVTAPNATSPLAANPNGENSSSGRSKLIPVIIIVLVLIALAIAAIAFFMHNKADEEAHTPTTIDLTFAFDGNKEPLGIPLHITGTDLDGQKVDEHILAQSKTQQIELLRGEYTIVIPSNIICEDGTVFKSANSNNSILIDITEEGVIVGKGEKSNSSEESNDTEVITVPSLTYTSLPEIDVTDEMLNEIRNEFASFDRATLVSNAITKAIDRRQTELQRIAEDERLRQQEEEKRQALASNPSGVYGTNMNQNAPSSQLTGVVRYQYCSVGSDAMSRGYVCYLQLSRPVELLGTQYGGLAASNVILPSSLANYSGQVVTISSHFSGRVTASIPEAAISPIWAYDAHVVKAWD